MPISPFDRHYFIASFLFHLFRAFCFKMDENVHCQTVQGESQTCNIEERISGVIIQNNHQMPFMAVFVGFTEGKLLYKNKAKNKTKPPCPLLNV